MRKRLLALLLVFVMVVGLLPQTVLFASAAYSGTCGENLTWTLDDNGALTISGTGAMKDYSYLSEAPWYNYRSEIKTVVIGDSVTSIGSDAFSDCDALTSVTIGNGVTSIGFQAFSICNALTEITIPDSVTSIGFQAFSCCDALTSITIPDSVLSIGSYAFSWCDALTEVYYGGDENDRSKISIGSNNTPLTDATWHSITKYNVTVSSVAGGVVSSDRQTAAEGKTVTLTVTPNAGYEFVTFLVDGVAISGNTFTMPKAAVTVTAEFKLINDVRVSTVNGAQIRTTGAQGLRFISSIDKTSLDFSRVVEYGTILIPSADLTDISELQIGATLNGHTVAKVPANYIYDESDDEVTFTAVITNVAAKNYAREYTARAYAIMDDGSVVYADAGASRSIYAVAKRGLENPNESDTNNEIFREIVDLVENS